MKIAVASGGGVAELLTGILTSKKYKVTVIDSDREFCERLAAASGADIICGDPCQEFILAEAGIRNYDVIVALCQGDEDNFEICQMGKKLFGIKKSVCLVKNPRNVELFEKLGVDQAVNLPLILAGMME